MSSTIFDSSVLGMSAQANWLATISQNVANSSTPGYKDAETEFSSLVDQVGGANAPGLGVSTSTLSLNSLQGSITGASAVTDLAIQGNGFFVVTDNSGNSYLTRSGSFVPDANGYLVNAQGYYLQAQALQGGSPGVAPGSWVDMPRVNVNQAGAQAVPSTAGTLSVNLPSTAAVVDPTSTPAAGGATYTNKTSLVAYDNSGSPVTLDIYMTKLANDANGNPQWQAAVYNQANASSGGGFPYSGAALASQTLSFNPASGQVTNGSSLSIAVPGGQTMSLDMSATTQLAAGFTVNSATTNGNAPATVTGVSVGSDGTLSFLYSSGTSFPAYSILLANVASPDSLTSVSGTAFSPNANSGQPLVYTPGTLGAGTIQSSSLEASTVDLSSQLTSMIQAQSGYQANSKVFQAGDDIFSVLNKLGGQ